MDLIGLKTVKKKLDDTVAEAAGGRVSGSSFGHFRLAMATTDVSHASTLRYCRLSSNKNHSGIYIGHCVKENTPSPRNVVNSGDSIGIFEVYCSQSGMEMVKTTPSDSSGYVADCGIADLPLADCSRMRATTVVHTGIFKDAFSDEWKEPEPESHTCIQK
jgi:hypothetical protein